MTTNHPSVALLHMADGKTVIARVSYDGPDGLKLNRPCELLVSLERGTGRKQIDFAPYLSILNTLPPIEEMDIMRRHVILKRAAPPDIADGYVSAVSGIQLAKSL
jgi:hypothetical protein